MIPSRPPVARIADVIAGDLEARILEGSLKPGDRLPSERDLAAELGVSRPSLREAIQRLVSKGLLVTRQGGGTVVTDRLEAPFVDIWRDMLASHPLLHGDMLEFRHMLEGQAAALAAQRATGADLERIGAAFEALEAAYAADDLAACIDRDVAFHQSIAEASHNALIGHLAASLLRVIHGHVSGNLTFLHERPPQWDQIRDQHRAIWDAIRHRHVDAASQAARAHIEFVRTSMTEAAQVKRRLGTALRRLGDAAR